MIKDEDAVTAIKEIQEDFLDSHVSTDASGQVQRAATRFAVIAAAGELATRYGDNRMGKWHGVRCSGNLLRVLGLVTWRHWEPENETPP